MFIEHIRCAKLLLIIIYMYIQADIIVFCIIGNSYVCVEFVYLFIDL